MAIAMSSHAADKNRPQALLHKDFYEIPIEKTDNQNTVDFFRMWLLDEPGKKILKLFLEEKIGFDPQRAIKTISFMEKTINNIDTKAQQLYTKQQASFINQYNEGRPEQEKAISYKHIQVDREAILKAEAVIQSKLTAMAENSINKLAKTIGKDSVLNINQWIKDYMAFSALPAPVDPQEYLREISEDKNYIHQKQTTPKQDNSTEFGVIKKQ